MQKHSGITIKDALEMMTRGLYSDEKKVFGNLRTWKEMDQDFESDSLIRRKSEQSKIERDGQIMIQDKATPGKMQQKVTDNIKCFKCDLNHYARNCPDRSLKRKERLGIHIHEESLNKPLIKLRFKN